MDPFRERLSMIHYTFDLETLGTSSQAPIVQLACIRFEVGPICTVVDAFDRRINIGDDWHRFTSDLPTIEWWLSQTEEVRARVFEREGRVDLATGLQDFKAWLLPHGGPRKFWSTSTFDPPILENAYRRLSLELPIKFREYLDIRTLKFLRDGRVPEIDRNQFGPQHDALADCHYQARQISQMLYEMKGIL